MAVVMRRAPRSKKTHTPIVVLVYTTSTQHTFCCPQERQQSHRVVEVGCDRLLVVGGDERQRPPPAHLLLLMLRGLVYPRSSDSSLVKEGGGVEEVVDKASNRRG